ncbi:hypothetical protein KUL49_15170 [Alteromonas sp. KUL49]|nr:hypothetical protein KUL49_15170 [Alteromonas sp. KUL49]
MLELCAIQRRYYELENIYKYHIVFYVGIANANPKINEAINVVQQLCLSGSEYEISADIKGNVTIKSFNPKANGSVTLNARESHGATAIQFQEDLRIIADAQIRECTQKHIGRVLDAVFSTTRTPVSSVAENNSIRRAKYIGFIPKEASVYGATSSENQTYFRFNVSKPSIANFFVTNLSKSIELEVLSSDGNVVADDNYSRRKSSPVNGGINDVLLLPNQDYFVKISPLNNGHSTSFKLSIVAEPAE